MGKLISVKEYAQVIGLSFQRIYVLLQNGKLQTAHKLRGKWKIDSDDRPPRRSRKIKGCSVEQRSLYMRDYYIENREKLAKYSHVYYLKHKEKIRKLVQDYLDANKNEVAGRRHLAYLKNKGKIRDYNRSYYEKHRDEIFEKRRLRRENEVKK